MDFLYGIKTSIEATKLLSHFNWLWSGMSVHAQSDTNYLACLTGLFFKVFAKFFARK